MRSESIARPELVSLARDGGNAQIYRKALAGLVVRETDKSTILIHAPAGHGKSTLLHQLENDLTRADENVVFFKLRREHNDISRFFSDLQKELEAKVGARAPLYKQKTVSHGKGLGFADYLLSQLALGSEKLNVIFDDFHELFSRAILSIITDLLDRSLPNVRFIIACREIPDISIERLLINGKALVLGAEKLRFSRAEIESFVSEWPEQSFDQDDIDFFSEWTLGWPAGLQLVKLMLTDKVSLSALKAKRNIELPLLTNYLADNVLAVLPSQTQDFLLKTSVLRSMSASLCEAVTGYPHSRSILENIERSGVFVKAIDESYEWFAYHSIFANFLKNQLQSQLPDTKNTVHRKALLWFRNHAMYEEAIYHAEAVQDFETMADLLDTWSSELIMKAHLDTVEYWYDRLPESTLNSRPMLAVRVSWALIFLRRFKKLETLLGVLDRQNTNGLHPDSTSVDVIRAVSALMNDDIVQCEKIIENIDIEKVSMDEFRAFELSAVANIRALYCLFKSRFEEARKLLAISHAYSTNASAVFSDSYSCGVNGFRLLAQGESSLAFSELEQEASSKEFYLAGAFAASALISCHAWILYERDQLRLAREELESSLEAIIESCLVDWAVMAFVTLSRIYFVNDELKRQNALLKRAETMGYARGWKRLVKVVQSERVRSSLLIGDISLAKSLNSRINLDEDVRWPAEYIGFYEDTECDCIREIRVSLHSGDPSGYAQVTDEILKAHSLGRNRRLLTLLILKALFEKKLSNIEASFSDLGKATIIASPEGYVRCFLDEGKEIGRLLIQLYSHAANRRNEYKSLDLAFIEKVVAAFGMSRELIQTQKRREMVLDESLTNREQQILTSLAMGASNKEIANTVFLSENTIKFHLKNIFSKLGVNNRTQAITVALEKKLID